MLRRAVPGGRDAVLDVADRRAADTCAGRAVEHDPVAGILDRGAFEHHVVQVGGVDDDVLSLAVEDRAAVARPNDRDRPALGPRLRANVPV